MVALEHQQGRKAIPADVSRARRLMASLEKCGAVERHTSLKDRYLVLYLPLARSDISEAAKRQEQSYQAALAEAVEDTQNCVGMDIYRARRAGTADATMQVTRPAPTAQVSPGRFAAEVAREAEISAVGSHEPSFPSGASKTAPGSGSPQQARVPGHPVATAMPTGDRTNSGQTGLTPASEVRQTSDRPAPEKSDRPIDPVSDCLNEENRTACEEVRQTSDRPVPTKSDRQVTNPFTPNLYINLDIPTAREPAPAHIHAGAASVDRALTEPPAGRQPERLAGGSPAGGSPAGGTGPAGGVDTARIRGAVRETLPGRKPATTPSAPPDAPQSRVRQNLDSRLVTVAVDDDSGVSVQVSPAFAAKHPDRLRELREIFSACAAGVAPPDVVPLPAEMPAGLGDGREGGLQ